MTWGKKSRASSVPREILHIINKHPTVQNRDALYKSTTPGAFIPGQIVGIYGNTPKNSPTGQSGWVLRKTGTGGRAGRVTEEVLVASKGVAQGDYDPNMNPSFEDLSDVQRFFRQAGFGAAPGEAESILSSGIGAGALFESWFNDWTNNVDRQYLPWGYPGYPLTSPSHKGGFARDNSGTLAIKQIWGQHRSIISRSRPGVLRARLAAALGKMCSLNGSINEYTSRTWLATLNSYFDLFDGSYRDYVLFLADNRYLQDSLDNVANWGRLNNVDREPNQNFVREMLQLYTLGQFKLNTDGTFQLDQNGNKIQTYVYQDVLNMARLFNAFYYQKTDGSLGDGYSTQTENRLTIRDAANLHYRGAVNMPTAGITRAAYGGAPPLGTKWQLGNNIYGKITEVCNWIENQDTSLVYMAKNFIHELVTENPSRDYVERVVTAMQNDGTGARGSLKHMIKAILLDEEARGSVSKKNAKTFGRALDYQLSVSAAFRSAGHVETPQSLTFNATFTAGNKNIVVAEADLNKIRAGQSPGFYYEDWQFFMSNHYISDVTPNNTTLSGYVVPQGTLQTDNDRRPAATIQRYSSTVARITLEGSPRQYYIPNFSGTLQLTINLNSQNDVGLIRSLNEVYDFQTGSTIPGIQNVPVVWGKPSSVFSDYPFDAEGSPGYLARAARLWASDAIIAMWNSTVYMSQYHVASAAQIAAPRATPNVWGEDGFDALGEGLWEIDHILIDEPGQPGTPPTFETMIRRAADAQLAGRSLPAAAVTKLAQALQLLTFNNRMQNHATDILHRRRIAAHAVSLINLMPQAMEQV